MLTEKPCEMTLLGEPEILRQQAQCFTRFFRQHIGASPSQYRRVVDCYAPV